MIVRGEVAKLADCLFCKIANKEIPSQVVYEDDQVFAFKDINPQAPAHVLVIPKKHIPALTDIQRTDYQLMADVFTAVNRIAKDLNLKDGFRVVTNCGSDGGQVVQHVHFHVLGGRKLDWPPG